MYNRTFDFISDAVRLEVFAIETSGALHREGRQFLRSHATATDPHNPDLQFSNILKTLSVAVQIARANCVIIARERLTLDTAPLVPFINGLLPVPPPVRLTLFIVHVRYDALTPPPYGHSLEKGGAGSGLCQRYCSRCGRHRCSGGS